MAAGEHHGPGRSAGAHGWISRGDQARRGAADTGGMLPPLRAAPNTRVLFSATISIGPTQRQTRLLSSNTWPKLKRTHLRGTSPPSTALFRTPSSPHSTREPIGTHPDEGGPLHDQSSPSDLSDRSPPDYLQRAHRQ